VGIVRTQLTTTYAAVDIGSNSVRLKIAAARNHRLKTLHEDREITRLGESVFDGGMVSPESMANTIRALRRFHRAVQAHAVDKLRVVATSALRDARNQQAFLAWVHSATGWRVEIISGLEEGRLIHLGVVSNEPAARGRCLLIDLGGGSCEVTISDHSAIREMVSLTLGAVRLTREFLRHDPPRPEEVMRMQDWIRRELRRAEETIGRERIPTVFATSGTAAALALAAKQQGKDKIKGWRGTASASGPKGVRAWERTPTAAVAKLAEKLKHMSLSQRNGVPGIGPKRSEIIVAGAHVYAALLEKFHLPGFRYSPMGLRDGILALMLAEGDTHTSAHMHFEQERWASVLELCRHYGVDPKRQKPVVEDATQFFNDLKAVHELPAEYKLWLEAAAMMHSIGKFMNYQGHHRHTQYIIANSELYGFTPEQRLIVAAIARYLGKSRPSPTDRAMRTIPTDQYRFVRQASMLLRLAVGLHQEQQASGKLEFRTRISGKRVTLELLPGRRRADLELWALRKEAGYFREVFGRDFFVVLD